jgi:sugar/nucleoside kinase (ribokinase family)
MKILVVGHLCFDVIHPVDGPEVESYGGIYYTVATLARLMGPLDTVVPVFGVHKADHPALVEHFKHFPNVNTSGIFKFDEPTNRVHLFYKDNQNRVECSRDIARPIPFEKLQRFLSVDGVLVNMISGFDLTLETLDQLRLAIRSNGAVTHFDFHSLTLGVKDGFERFRRPLDDWRRWAFMMDTVQLNEEEIAGLPPETMTERQTAGHLLTLGVKGVVVTKGARGATLYMNSHKRIVHEEFAGVTVDHPRDSTGCGDVFGAALHLKYAQTKDLQVATAYANRVAAAKVGSVGVEGLRRLGEVAA